VRNKQEDRGENEVEKRQEKKRVKERRIKILLAVPRSSSAQIRCEEDLGKACQHGSHSTLRG